MSPVKASAIIRQLNPDAKAKLALLNLDPGILAWLVLAACTASLRGFYAPVSVVIQKQPRVRGNLVTREIIAMIRQAGDSPIRYDILMKSLERRGLGNREWL